MPENNLLSISLTANDGTNHIYLSSDTSLNVLTLTLTNPNTSSVYFQQYSGNNCGIGQLASTDSGIYLLFNGMLANSEIANITCNQPGWTLSHFSDAQSGNYLVLTAQSTVLLAAGQSLSFELQLPAVSGTASSGYLSCQCVNVLFTYPRNCGQQLYITKVYPPRQDGTAAAQLPVQFEFIGSNIIHNSNTNNSLSFRITNTGTEALVPGGTSSWGSSSPQFSFYFIQDEGSSVGSVVTSSQAKATSINLLDNYTNKLKVSQNKETTPVTWTIEEDESLSNLNGTILGTGISASVSFSITNLYTSVPHGISMAVLEYSGFPGYPDGQLTVELEVHPPLPVINQFYADKPVINIIHTNNSFNLLYKVSNSSSVFIYKDTSSAITGLYNPDSSSLYSFNTYVSQTTAFTLVATGSAGEKVSATIVVQVDTVPIGTIMMWSGTYLNLPTGWHVCDGGTYNNVLTPNLRDKFIYGANQFNETIDPPVSDSLGYIGGHSSHSHTFSMSGVAFTVSGGSHSHYINFDGTTAVQSGSSNSNGNNYYHGKNGNDSIEYTDGNNDGAHSHSVSADSNSHNTGSSSNIPPYCALYFIMKCV
jgi:hypothetical protein